MRYCHARSGSQTPNVRARFLAVGALGALSLLSIAVALSGCPGPPSSGPPGPELQGVLWLQFAQISDTHILDDESPARFVRLGDLISGAWRPQDSYTTQVLDATLRVLNEYHTGALQPQHRLNFVIHTGDLVDNAQNNELTWFMGVMDGRTVQPDSGAIDGPGRPVAPEDNPKLAFQAVGLLAEIPWYVVHGNHDMFCSGNFPIDRDTVYPDDWIAPLLGPVAAVDGLHLLDCNLNWLAPTNNESPAIILGNMDIADPATLLLPVAQLKAGAIVPDPERHFIDKDIFAAAQLASTSQPAGHGLTAVNRTMSSLTYSVRPVPDVPVRLIVLDTAAPAPPNELPFFYGVMTRDQFDHFLKPTIQTAQQAGEWVLVASHHPSADFNIPFPASTVGQSEFRAYLAAQPNIIAHICGHTHRNHMETVNGTHPYPEIETCSTIDYPQEARIYQIYYIAETRTIRLQSTMVSHMDDPTRLSAESFRRASIISGNPPPAKADGAPIADLFPPDAPGANTIEQGAVMGKEERYGRPEDRDFSITLHRPDFSGARP